MATIKELRERQSSVKTIHKITKAMELVSIAKSQKATRLMAQYQDYFRKVLKIVNDINNEIEQKDVEATGTVWLVLTSDLGLAGGYNSSIMKELYDNLKDNDEIIMIGQKGIGMLKSKFPAKVFTQYLSSNEHLPQETLDEVSTRILNAYKEGKEIKALYTKYISQIKFSATVKQILPIDISEEELDDEARMEAEQIDKLADFEPNPEEILKHILNVYVGSTIVALYRQSYASEQTSRRIAMENATKNGEDMMRDLQIQYNRTRQAKITQEITEIVSGSNALE